MSGLPGFYWSGALEESLCGPLGVIVYDHAETRETGDVDNDHYFLHNGDRARCVALTAIALCDLLRAGTAGALVEELKRVRKRKRALLDRLVMNRAGHLLGGES